MTEISRVESSRITDSLEQLKIDTATLIAKVDMIYDQQKEESIRIRSLENKDSKNNDNRERIVKIESEIAKVQSLISKAIGILLVVSPMYVGIVTWIIKHFTAL